MAALMAGLLAGAQSEAAMEFRLTSAAFVNNQAIPSAHSCQGDDTSPGLRWQGEPRGTRSLALVLRDPDAPAGEFVHWVLYDLPAAVTELPSGHYTSGRFPLGGYEGQNDFGDLGYGGPCPPPGRPHHYVFTLYALSAPSLGLAAGASRDEVMAAMQGKVLAQTELVGLYGRSGQ
ncbi:MAG TPA: YbhB/YbcL family Raf kinase inhibitor-like protein [Terriglobales bacterium]|nr:YbhB/YbcL family Raf kinase inhibitor-like protein [Terriglobales bacterium]